MKWKYKGFSPEEGIIRYQLLDEKGDVVGVICRTSLDEPAYAHADRIVRAVNSYEALLAALREMLGLWQEYEGAIECEISLLPGEAEQVIVARALAALKAAEGDAE